MRKEYTKEQKAEYFKKLRDRWAVTKRIANEDEIKAIMIAHGIGFSIRSYVFVKMQMDALGLEGTPYVDCKTFLGWKENGFMVRKGETSKLDGITWIGINTGQEHDADDASESDHTYLMPKVYHLFHRTQVDAL